LFMKIRFTCFNDGQEHFEFDTESLAYGEQLDKFLVSKDMHGKIYIVPMIRLSETTFYSKDVLEKIES
jgi:hypothetical protein